MPDPAGASGQANWRLILARTLPQVDLFVPSVEELLFMLHRVRFDELTSSVGAAGMLEALTPDEIVALADEALDMGAKMVLLKMGTLGLYLRTEAALSDIGRGAPSGLPAWAGRQLWVSCYQPDRVASTVGTGDAAIAGFLAALLRGASPGQALNVAAATGACCVEEPGALEGVRPWGETLVRVEAGWARLPLDPAGTGWVWDGQDGVWRGPADRVQV